MEKILISLKPATDDGLEVTFENNFRDADAARDYARLQLLMGGGVYHKAVVSSHWKQSDMCWRQCIDPIVYNNNL